MSSISNGAAGIAVKWQQAEAPQAERPDKPTSSVAVRSSIKQLKADFTREAQPLQQKSVFSRLGQSQAVRRVGRVFRRALGNLKKQAPSTSAAPMGQHRTAEMALSKQLATTLERRRSFCSGLEHLTGTFGKSMKGQQTLGKTLKGFVQGTASFFDIPTSSKKGKFRAEQRNNRMHLIANSLDAVNGNQQASGLAGLHQKVLGAYTVGAVSGESELKGSGEGIKAVRDTCLHLEQITRECDNLLNGFEGATRRNRGSKNGGDPVTSIPVPPLPDGHQREMIMKLKAEAADLQAQLVQDFQLKPEDLK